MPRTLGFDRGAEKVCVRWILGEVSWNNFRLEDEDRQNDTEWCRNGLKVELRKDVVMETVVEVTVVLVQGCVQRRQDPRPFAHDCVVVADLVRRPDRGTDAADPEMPHASSRWDLSQWLAALFLQLNR
jgi:hypothetical protein